MFSDWVDKSDWEIKAVSVLESLRMSVVSAWVCLEGSVHVHVTFMGLCVYRCPQPCNIICLTEWSPPPLLCLSAPCLCFPSLLHPLLTTFCPFCLPLFLSFTLLSFILSPFLHAAFMYSVSANTSVQTLTCRSHTRWSNGLECDNQKEVGVCLLVGIDVCAVIGFLFTCFAH